MSRIVIYTYLTTRIFPDHPGIFLLVWRVFPEPTQNCLRLSYTAAAWVSSTTDCCPIDQWQIHKLWLKHLQIVHELEQAIGRRKLCSQRNYSLWVSDYCSTSPCALYHNMIYYSNISTGEMVGYHFKQYCTLHVFQKVYIDVTHNHADKYPTWSESVGLISISVLIHSLLFVPRRNGV